MLALLSQTCTGTFFKDAPICYFGGTPLSYLAVFGGLHVLKVCMQPLHSKATAHSEPPPFRPASYFTRLLRPLRPCTRRPIYTRACRHPTTHRSGSNPSAQALDSLPDERAAALRIGCCHYGFKPLHAAAAAGRTAEFDVLTREYGCNALDLDHEGLCPCARPRTPPHLRVCL